LSARDPLSATTPADGHEEAAEPSSSAAFSFATCHDVGDASVVAIIGIGRDGVGPS
jgi:hypothetical protein